MMQRFRDPMLVAQFLAAVVGVLVAFNAGVTDEQTGLWVAAINAVAALVQACLVRPVTPSVITGAFSAVAAVVVGYGFEITPEQVGAINFVLTMGLAFFFVRPNSTPVSSPAIGQGVTSKDVNTPIHRTS